MRFLSQDISEFETLTCTINIAPFGGGTRGRWCMYSLYIYAGTSLTLNPNPNLTLNPNPKP